jgi:hypothetical protein
MLFELKLYLSYKEDDKQKNCFTTVRWNPTVRARDVGSGDADVVIGASLDTHRVNLNLPSLWSYWNYGICCSFRLNRRPVLASQPESVQKNRFSISKNVLSELLFLVLIRNWFAIGHKHSPSVSKSLYSSQKYCCKVEAIDQYVCSRKKRIPCFNLPNDTLFYSATSYFKKHGFLLTSVNIRQLNTALNIATEPIYITVRNFWTSSADIEVQRPSNEPKKYRRYHWNQILSKQPRTYAFLALILSAFWQVPPVWQVHLQFTSQ